MRLAKALPLYSVELGEHKKDDMPILSSPRQLNGKPKESIMKEETTSSYASLAHSKWDCKYHIVWIPKSRKKILFGQIRSYLGPVFRELARQKECEIVEGKTMSDHVHMLIKIPPKHSVASIVGYIKGKSAIAVARQFHGKKRNFNGQITCL